jgi:transposase
METDSEWAPGPGIEVTSVAKIEGRWVVSATMEGCGRCPTCDVHSYVRHGWYVRRLQDLPAQGAGVELRLKLARRRCANAACTRQTFSDRRPEVVPAFARRTRRVIELARLLAHTAGGRPTERLMTSLGMPQSNDTLLRLLKREVAKRHNSLPVRVVGIDDWSWRKGARYGTIMVDLERREVLDVLEDRSAETTARWLGQHPTVEVVSRDRCGLYAQGTVQGAPQALQVADRFHLLQNLQHAIKQQLSRAPRQSPLFVPSETADPLTEPAGIVHRYGQPGVTDHHRLVRAGRRAARQAGFDRVKALHAEGKPLCSIARETGFNWRTVRKWTRQDELRPRQSMAPKSTTPSGFRDHLVRRWMEGCTIGRELLAEIRPLGYTGSLTHLNTWRRAHFAAAIGAAPPEATTALDNTVMRVAPPIVAAALCIKPRGLLSEAQATKVDKLKATSSEFTTMRQLAMRFRGILRGRDVEPLDGWLSDAARSGMHCMRQFARTLRQDLAAVQNAIREPWSNGQTEGQINRLKTLKRAMYGRAGVHLLRARMLPFHAYSAHRD